MRRPAFAVVLLLSLVLPQVPPAVAAPYFQSGGGVSVTVTGAEVLAGGVMVRGDVIAGFSMSSWGLNPDDELPGAITGYFLESDLGLGVFIGLWFGGGIPAGGGGTAYSWPVKVDGRDDGRWLAAGTRGTGMPPSTAGRGWLGVCTSVTAPCAPVYGGFGDYGTSVLWGELWPQDLGGGSGSTLELGSANGGVVSQFVWPAAPTTDGVGALSTLEDIPGIKLSGEVRLGIAPSGTPEEDIDYAVRATTGGPPPTGGPSEWSGELSRPAVPGSYDVHARSCVGLLADLDCDHQVVTVTV